MSPKAKPKMPGQRATNMQVRARDLDKLEKAIANGALGPIDLALCRGLHEQIRSGKLAELGKERRAWLACVLEDATKGPKYENLVSSGKAPRGADVVLNVGRLPLDPPTRAVIRWKDGMP